MEIFQNTGYKINFIVLVYIKIINVLFSCFIWDHKILNICKYTGTLKYTSLIGIGS